MAIATRNFFNSRRQSAPVRSGRRMLPTTDTSLLYRPNETLDDRNELLVNLDDICDSRGDDSDDHNFGDSYSDAYNGESGIEITPQTPTSSYSHVSTLHSTPVSFNYAPRQSHTRMPATSPAQTHHMQQSPICGPPQSNIIGMLQEQQALLHKIINKQQEMSQSVKRNDKRIAILEEHLVNSTSESSSSTSSLGETKQRLVTKDLTDKVHKIHSALEPEGFRPEESSLSPFNADVKSKIIAEICGDENLKYSEKQVKAAVQRKYESVRRAWKTDDNEEIIQKKAREKKYKARRRRKFDNRSLVVSEGEMFRWKQINIEYMSEESDDKLTDQLIIHSPQWRSSELADLILRLDERYNDKVRKDGTAMARKPRRVGSQLLSSPPVGAPEWAVKQNWKDASSSIA